MERNVNHADTSEDRAPVELGAALPYTSAKTREEAREGTSERVSDRDSEGRGPVDHWQQKT